MSFELKVLFLTLASAAYYIIILSTKKMLFVAYGIVLYGHISSSLNCSRWDWMWTVDQSISDQVQPRNHVISQSWCLPIPSKDNACINPSLHWIYYCVKHGNRSKCSVLFSQHRRCIHPEIDRAGETPPGDELHIYHPLPGHYAHHCTTGNCISLSLFNFVPISVPHIPNWQTEIRLKTEICKWSPYMFTFKYCSQISLIAFVVVYWK